MYWILSGVGILMILNIVISPSEEKLLFAAVSPYFLIQFTDDIFGIRLAGLASGGASSPLQIGICVVISGAVLVLFLSQNSAREKVSFEYSKFPLIIFAWIGLILLQCVSVYLDPTKWVPIASLMCFAISSVSIFFFGSDLEKILRAITYWGLIGSGVIVMGIVSKKEWTATDSNFTDSLYEKNTYFSPLSELIGLPTRNNFYFNSGPQILGITFALLFCVALALSSSTLKWGSLVLFLGIGSLSGSRTFYGVVIMVTVVQILLTRSKFVDFNLLKIAGVLVGITVSVFYTFSTITSNTGISTLNGRSIIWSLITTHWNDNSLLGHGPGSLAAFARNSYTYFPFVHAHNSFLQLLWDYGILGVSLAILISALVLISIDLRAMQGFTLVVIGLFVVQTEITLEASVLNPFPLFWVAASIQVLHKNHVYQRKETE